MRTICELVIIAALLVVGWEKPFGQWINDARRTPVLQAPHPPTTRVAAQPFVAPQPRASASVSGSWMWDPERRTPLDRPAYNPRQSFTGHIYYNDEIGRRYWLDGSGKRHYDP